MTIEYKTEGRCVIDADVLSNGLAITWLEGSGTVTIHQGGFCKLTLSKKQLQKLGGMSEVIADDLQPEMHSLPRPA